MMSDDDDDRVIAVRSTATGGKREAKPWTKHVPSKQDKINRDPSQIQENLVGFEQIAPAEYATVAPGTFIRYVSCLANNKQQLRLGGVLVRNSAPEYWVLKSGRNKTKSVTWSVALKPTAKNPALNIFYRKKGMMCKDDNKQQLGAELFSLLESRKFFLVSAEKLQSMTGAPVPGADSRSAVLAKKKH